MDLTAIIDTVGEPWTAALGGAMIGLLFGFFAQRSQFCLRAAAVEFAHGKIGPKLAIWLLAFSMAVLGTQMLVMGNELAVGEARQLSSPQSLSGAIIGGLMFGVGMVLARGCASRLLVLSATGNLRALVSGLIFAVVAQASLRGFLAPLRTDIASWWTTASIPTNDALYLLGVDNSVGLGFALLWLIGAITFAALNKLGFWAWVGGIGVGLTIPLGWWFTYTLSSQAFDPVQIESISFTGPSADTLMLFLSPPGSILDFDVGLVPGVFAGSFLAAILYREAKLQGFGDGLSMRRYIIGAVLMGFGGMLAGGCAVGAGVTGGAIFAVTAWLTLFSIWIAATLTDMVVDRPKPAEPHTPKPIPAE
jgi:uncharacterized membrane protein YedE/YeeE